jgi:preprotein translocase subunit SecA
MVSKLVRKIFGSRNDRLIKQYSKIVKKINDLEDSVAALTDEELQAQTQKFRDRVQEGESLEQLLPEAFATVREAGKRVMEMRHFDVQLIGGMVLNDGNIAEMKTGEGKTLVATLAAYLNALSGKGVHVITVNDYLAKRDAEWMGTLYGFLGLSTGVIVGGLDNQQRREAYACDITYGTNNEFGFDYLRDNMSFNKDDRVQRVLNFAIVDEVDSILIDEARTPLIISGPTNDNSDLYIKFNELVQHLVKQEEEDGPGDYSIDEEHKQAFMTESGQLHVEELLRERDLLQEDESLYDAQNIGMIHHLNAALRANTLFQKDVDYIVQENQIIIVDEFTGRTMPGRRWSDGLHQAMEAKEGVVIQNENQTLASITFQNYFRLYEKLSGMTGTADTEAFEFQQIYGLEVVVIPTHRPMTRDDMNDVIFLSQREKFNAIIKDIKYCIEHKRPSLVGTASIEVSEFLSAQLKKEKIKHEVLNAKQHEREASIIENAGLPGAVTIATNMAGRGTDIVLGGNLNAEIKALGENPDPEKVKKVRSDWQQSHEQVIKAGGLHIIGTERHESRRIDNQLRGRAGRQGDAGSSRFYLSLEDNLMRIFASNKFKGMMQKLGMKEGEAIENALVTRAIENAQRKVEGHNYDIRKNLLEYDDVANDQRKVVYQQRSELLETDDVHDMIEAIRADVIHSLIDQYVPPGSLDEQWDISRLMDALKAEFGIQLEVQQWLDDDDHMDEEAMRARILEDLDAVARSKEEEYGADLMKSVERDVMLQVLDTEWKEHLLELDQLRQGINLRGYAQKNPKQEYKREAFERFETMLERIKHEVTKTMLLIRIRTPEDMQALEAQMKQQPPMEFKHDEASGIGEAEASSVPEGAEHHQPYRREGEKIGRNDPCWCGSGKKFKHCHGKLN